MSTRDMVPIYDPDHVTDYKRVSKEEAYLYFNGLLLLWLIAYWFKEKSLWVINYYS